KRSCPRPCRRARGHGPGQPGSQRARTARSGSARPGGPGQEPLGFAALLDANSASPAAHGVRYSTPIVRRGFLNAGMSCSGLGLRKAGRWNRRSSTESTRCALIMHNVCMPLIQIRDVPESVRDELARKAAAAGQSMQAYLLGELSKLAERPSMAEIV